MSTDVITKAKQLAARAKSESAARNAGNRLRFPEHARIADEWRAIAKAAGFDSLAAGLRWGRVWDEHGEWTRPGYVDPGPGVPLSDWLPRELRDKRGKR